MPALFLLLGLAAVVAIAARSGHSKKSTPSAAISSPPAGTVELDRGMPELIVRQVLSALAGDTNRTHLEEIAHHLEPRYPLAAGELRAKAALLRTATAAEVTPAHFATPPVAAAPTMETPAPAHSATVHELQAANVLQAAMRALVEESDPVVLEGFAESIRTLYPTAATLLLARAHALRVATAPAAHASLQAAGPPKPAVATATHTDESAAPSAGASPPSPMESHA
jgi:hypothetical protein